MIPHFYLKSPKNDVSLVMMRIYDSRFKDGVFNYSTKEYIDVKKWNVKDGVPKNIRENDSLVSLLKNLEQNAIDFMRDNSNILTRDNLRDFLNNALRPEPKIEAQLPAEKSIIEEWQEWLNNRNNIEPKTLVSYTNVFVTFKEFLKNNPGLLPEAFNIKMFEAYETFLNKKFASPNTVAKHKKIFKRFFRYLKKVNSKLTLDLDDVTYREGAGIKISCSESDLEKLSQLQITKSGEIYKQSAQRLNDIRWLWLLQCSTGFRVSDLFRIPDHVEGDFIFDMETQKVKGKKVTQYLTPIAKKVLEMYDYKLPFINEKDYREGIKELYRMIEPKKQMEVRVKGGFKKVYVWEEISSHDAVRTFINLCIDRGLSVTDIAHIVGKSVTVIIKHYLVDNKKAAIQNMKLKMGGLSFGEGKKEEPKNTPPRRKSLSSSAPLTLFA